MDRRRIFIVVVGAYARHGDGRTNRLVYWNLCSYCMVDPLPARRLRIASLRGQSLVGPYVEGPAEGILLNSGTSRYELPEGQMLWLGADTNRSIWSVAA
jgi:hypothetical protein